MISSVVTDTGKEASVAHSGSTDVETRPKTGSQFASHGRRTPFEAAPLRCRVRPAAGLTLARDLQGAFLSTIGSATAIGLRGNWRAGRFRSGARRIRPEGLRGPLPDGVAAEPGRLQKSIAALRDCNLHSSRAQFVRGANRVFDRQIDAS